MKYQLSAPQYLLPTIAARLSVAAPTLEYSLCTPQIDNPDPEAIQLIFQSDFFHPKKTTATVDVFVLPSPLAGLHGFMLMAGGSQQSLDLAAPILDALAPITGGWLHAGDVGSAGFFHQLWNILVGNQVQGLIPLWENMKSPNLAFPINHPDLVNQLSSFLAQQQLLTQSLVSCAERYLSEYSNHPFTPYHVHQGPLLGQNEIKQSPAHEIAKLLQSFKV